jgi:hypothetical protein
MAAIANWLSLSRNGARGCPAVHGALPDDQLVKELRGYAGNPATLKRSADGQRIAPDRPERNYTV